MGRFKQAGRDGGKKRGDLGLERADEQWGWGVERSDRVMPDFLSVRCPGFEVPEPGALVEIAVQGTAHVLPE